TLQHQVAREVYDDRQQDHFQSEVKQRVDQSLWFIAETEYEVDVGCRVSDEIGHWKDGPSQKCLPH
ncbi:MAG: hypothetical protein GTO40_11595, partial [Deltaproteobacteria bacterium]|nr:hypothetical protein [Deltaproteobacteria bacterium]